MMIHLSHIYRRLRKVRGYQKKALAKHLQVSNTTISSYEDNPYQQHTYEMIREWAQFLDLTDKEIEWCIQYYQREQVFAGLTYSEVPYHNRRAIADLCTFFPMIPKEEREKLIAQIQKLVLPHILPQPPAIREIIYAMKEKD